jgi:hypothetical protein
VSQQSRQETAFENKEKETKRNQTKEKKKSTRNNEACFDQLTLPSGGAGNHSLGASGGGVGDMEADTWEEVWAPTVRREHGGQQAQRRLWPGGELQDENMDGKQSKD